MHNHKFLLMAVLQPVFLLLWLHSNQAVANDTAPLSIDDARHLITRTGFGASPNELNQLIGKSRFEAVTSIVDGLHGEAHSHPPAWVNNSAPHHYQYASLSTPDKQKFRQTRLNEIQSLRLWWVNEMISTTIPQKERLLLFWHNHFATAYSAINHQSISIARQHVMLREHAAGNFRTMLQNIIHDPAMLNYLDNNNSKKKKPNENLARELMELFALGEGNYTEADVKNAARALSGYSFSATYDMRYVFQPWNHDTGVKTLFGKTNKYNGDDLVNLILEQPAAARFITAKLWRLLISDIEQNDARLTAHANTFRNADYDIKTLYQSLLLSDAFWHQKNRANLVKSPVTLAIGTIRSTGILPTDWQTLPSQLRLMGQHLFEPPNVAGWPGGASWITPGRILARQDWLVQLTIPTSNPFPDTHMSMGNTSNTIENKNLQAKKAHATDAMHTQKMIAPDTSSKSGEHLLGIQMAAEEFDERVKYHVKVHGEHNTVWDSGVLELAGGHDTKRMGRVSYAELPRQTINFPIHIAANDITSIEISFVNDDSTPDGADRNLFVHHATLDNRVWLAEEGIQTGKCPSKKPDQQGRLYCTGTLTMVKSQSTTTHTSNPPATNNMRVSGVNLNSVQPATRKPNTDLVFTLSDVEFDGRFWDSLNVLYSKHNSGHALRLNTNSCWPACLIQWPDCARIDEHNSTTLSVELESDSTHCMYQGLQEADKKLTRALWMSLDKLYQLGYSDPKMQKPRVAHNYKQWQKMVTDIKHKLPSSAFFDNTISLEVVPRSIIDSTLNEISVSPLPAGRTTEQRDADLAHLFQHNHGSDLATVLLPMHPADGKSRHSNQLSDILSDLSFQLQ